MDLEYGFTLVGAENEEPLICPDERFPFQFEVIPSGVFFSVRNLSSEPAFIDWEHCFVVTPDGNTFNALNTDILDESDEVALRSVHRTQLPVNTTVSRFTTATVGITEETVLTIHEVSSMLSTTNVTWSPNYYWAWANTATARTSSDFSRTLTSTSADTWRARRYWPPRVEAPSGEEVEVLQGVSESIGAKPAFGLGIRIVQGEVVTDYRFDFKIDAIFAISEKRRAGLGSARKIVHELIYFAFRKDGWKWKEAKELGA